MYIINGIAYAGDLIDGIEVRDVLVLDDMMLLLTFSTGEKRLFDSSILLEYPAFKPLSDVEVFKNVKIEHGVLVWLDGDIDIAPETLYKNSFSYLDAFTC